MLRRLFVVGVVSAAAFVWAGSALADTTIGQTSSAAGCASDDLVLQTGVSSGQSFTVPSGDWVITSWSTQASSETGPMQAVVAQPTGVPDQYTIVGESAAETLTPNTLNTFSTSIAVQGGDILGFWLGGLTSCENVTSNSGDTWELITGVNSSPSVGSTATYIPGSGGIMNISATLTPASGGWIRPPDHMFVCYSKYEQDGGALFTDGPGAAEVAAGGWLPAALPGNLEGGDNIGTYHLACNPPAGSTPTGEYVSDGGATSDANDPGSYPIYKT